MMTHMTMDFPSLLQNSVMMLRCVNIKHVHNIIYYRLNEDKHDDWRLIDGLLRNDPVKSIKHC